MPDKNRIEGYGTVPLAPQRKTPGGVYSDIERGLKECLASRHFTKDEMRQILDFFGKNPPECVYCGSKDVERWDHLVSINNGGETVWGNIVPACQKCDDSKGTMQFEEWMKSNRPKSPLKREIIDIDDRIRKIKDYVAQSGYKVRMLEKRLNENERKELKAIRVLNAESRRRTEKLVAGYRERTGDS